MACCNANIALVMVALTSTLTSWTGDGGRGRLMPCRWILLDAVEAAEAGPVPVSKDRVD